MRQFSIENSHQNSLSFPKVHTRRLSELFRHLVMAGSKPELI